MVLAVFAVLQLTLLNHLSKRKPTPVSTVLMPVQVFPDALFQQLTTDIQGNNEKAFLSMVAPSARPAVQTWWGNMEAMGFTTGLIMPTNKSDQVNLNSKGDGTTVVLAGTHNALDPVNSGKADVPLESYRIGLHFSGPRAIGQITSWKPLGNAPWDQGKLYVRKAGDVEVVGQASDRTLVGATLPIAQAAADYVVGLVNHVHAADLRQKGFVVFVSGDPAVRARWFSTTAQPSQWPPAQPAAWPPAQPTGLTVQLPGPGASIADPNWSAGGLAQDSTGGARVVITPYAEQSGATKQTETDELVSCFALDLLSASDQGIEPGTAAPSPPAWAIEGFGAAFEAAYLSNPNPALSTYSFKALNDDLKKLSPVLYKTGYLPQFDDLYTNTADAESAWTVVAGSVYAYIATKAGMGQMLYAAQQMWTEEPDPRANVRESVTSQGATYFDKNTIQAGWQAYLVKPTDTAPALGPAGG